MESSITQYLYKKNSSKQKNSRLSIFFVPQSQKVCGSVIAGMGDLKKKKHGRIGNLQTGMIWHIFCSFIHVHIPVKT